MKVDAGYTFIELMVVLGVIAVLASFSVTLIPNVVKPRSLALEAESLGTEFFLLLSEARASRRTMRLACEPKAVKVDVFEGVRSNTLSPAGEAPVGLDARVQTQSRSFTQKTLLPERSQVIVTCPTGCGGVFITSDGYLLSESRCRSLEFILAKQGVSSAQFKLTLSNNAFPRLYTRASADALGWKEVVR